MSGKGTKFVIHRIERYHYFCEADNQYNIYLSEVNSSTTPISKQVQCVDNAVSSDGNSTNGTVLCTSKGEWIVGNEGCVCIEGFYSLNNKRCSRK